MAEKDRRGKGTRERVERVRQEEERREKGQEGEQDGNNRLVGQLAVPLTVSQSDNLLWQPIFQFLMSGRTENLGAKSGPDRLCNLGTHPQVGKVLIRCCVDKLKAPEQITFADGAAGRGIRVNSGNI